MNASRHYGHAAGAKAVYARSGSGRLISLEIGRIDRRPNLIEDRNEIRFTLRRKIAPAIGQNLADRLSALKLAYNRGELHISNYRDAIDCAIVDFETRPMTARKEVAK